MSGTAGTSSVVAADDAQLRLATALAAAETKDAVAAAVLQWGAPASHAAGTELAVWDGSGPVLRTVGDGRRSEHGWRWDRCDAGTGTTLHDTVRCGAPILRASAGGAVASLPLPGPNGNGDCPGAVGFRWTTAQRFTPRQLARLRLIVGLTGQALARVAALPRSPLALGRAAAQALQEAFLPSVPATTGDLETAAAYLPASESTMGGDWFDVFPVEDGTCVVVGDIGGHGLRAAALMAEVRSAIRGFAVDDPSPARVVTRANRMLCRLHPEATATVVVGVWAPARKTWTRCNAGHPPVLRCRAGEFGYLSPGGPGGAMLGTVPDGRYVEEPKVLRDGTTLLLYTDGLVESRRQPITAGMDDLLAHVEGLSDLAPQSVVADVLLWRLGRGPCTDDLCVLAARVAVT